MAPCRNFHSMCSLLRIHLKIAFQHQAFIFALACPFYCPGEAWNIDLFSFTWLSVFRFEGALSWQHPSLLEGTQERHDIISPSYFILGIAPQADGVWTSILTRWVNHLSCVDHKGNLHHTFYRYTPNDNACENKWSLSAHIWPSSIFCKKNRLVPQQNVDAGGSCMLLSKYNLR